MCSTSHYFSSRNRFCAESVLVYGPLIGLNFVTELKYCAGKERLIFILPELIRSIVASKHYFSRMFGYSLF